MMNITISEKNRAKIESALAAVQSRARVRTVSFDDMMKAIETLEHRLNIAKKDMIGISAEIDINAQNFPNAYRFIPESTHFYIVRKTSGWTLTDIERERVNRQGHTYTLTLPEETQRAIVNRMKAF